MNDVEKLADKIVDHIEKDGDDDVLLRLFNRCARHDIDAALQLAENKLREKADHLSAIQANWSEVLRELFPVKVVPLK